MIQSNNRKEFDDKLMKVNLKKNKVKYIFGSPLHPQFQDIVIGM